METTVSVKLSKAEVDLIFADMAKRKAQEMLLHPELFNCAINVDMDKECSVLQSIEINFKSKSE
jgi:hypothetical protein